MREEEDSRDRVAYLRQLAIDSITNYSGGFAELQRIDQDVDSIIHSLEGIANQSWINSLIEQWGVLEIIYASALSDERYQLTQDEEEYVQDAITKLLAELRNYELQLNIDEKAREHDVVRLRRPLSKHNLPAGSRGTVVVDYTQYSDGTLPSEYEVEFADSGGSGQIMVTVPEDDLEVVSRPGYGKLPS